MDVNKLLAAQRMRIKKQLLQSLEQQILAVGAENSLYHRMNVRFTTYTCKTSPKCRTFKKAWTISDESNNRCFQQTHNEYN